MAEGHPLGPKAPSSRSERAARRAEKMRARSARFFSWNKKKYFTISTIFLQGAVRGDEGSGGGGGEPAAVSRGHL